MDGFYLDIDLQQAFALSEAAARHPDIFEEEMVPATWQAELLLQREVQEHTPVGIGGGGGLKGSISARTPRVFSDNVIGVVGTPLEYAVPVELGTKPHMPPVQPLADWAQHKLGVSEEEAQGIGFAIARKIARQGTEGAHMFERGFKGVERQVHEIFEAAFNRIYERIGDLA